MESSSVPPLNSNHLLVMNGIYSPNYVYGLQLHPNSGEKKECRDREDVSTIWNKTWTALSWR